MTTPAPAKPDWHRAAQVATFDGRPFIGGAARSPRSRARFPTLCPFTEQPLATFPDANADDIARAVLAPSPGFSDVSRMPGPDTPTAHSAARARAIPARDPLLEG